MRYVKTLGRGLALTLILAAPAGHAQTLSAEAQLQTFATCVGRLTAELEYEWSTQGAYSDEAAFRRDATVQLVAAIVSDEQSRDVLHWRDAAKRAQYDLLSRSQYSRDQAEAEWAKSRAAMLEQECTSLLLG
ncbi:hypothetical protein [Yoonia sp. SDW83-1]|uniref:hypothetical protein n=1 Tax=Yoonia sp. SDW83-1 TaxID=3366945 RepID=UPI00398C7614